MKIAIVGAGGTGGYFGWLLARAGEDVSFIARGRHLEAMQRAGLLVKSPRWEPRRVPVRAVSDAGGIGAVDLVLVCVKTYDLVAALAPLGALLGPHTVVLGLQNGVDDSALVDFAGEGRCLSGVAQVVARIEGPGTIEHAALGTVVLGERRGEASPRAKTIAQTLQQAGIDVTVSDAMPFERWKKLIWIAAQAGLTTLTRRGMGEVLSSTQGQSLYRSILEEAATVAEKEGVGGTLALVEPLFQMAMKVAASNPTVTSSMCSDLLRGGRLELEAIHGDLLRRAERHRVGAPGLLAIYVALLPFLNGAGPA